MRFALLLAALGVLCLGCSDAGAPAPTAGDKTTQTAPAATAPDPHASMAPVAGAKEDLKALEADQKKAKDAYTKTPSDDTKKAYVAATVKFATASMVSEDLDRKIKYKQALQYYREALQVDPKNAEAKNNSEMIVEIYKQMGRPVPN